MTMTPEELVKRMADKAGYCIRDKTPEQQLCTAMEMLKVVLSAIKEEEVVEVKWIGHKDGYFGAVLTPSFERFAEEK